MGVILGYKFNITKFYKPISVSLSWNQASSVQYRISVADTKSTPPPIHALWMAAITGLSH